MSDLVGQTIGKYRVVSKLGRGGMAVVYKAYQANLDRYVAIKVLHGHLADDTNFVQRFEREAKVVASLRHPNIVQVFDFDKQDDLYYMAMEFINGPTLKLELEERHRHGQLFTLEETGRIMVALCQAIDYAHSRGMVHRDLKPANFILTEDGQILILDFGIAKIVGDVKHTLTGAVIGTPAYMSPEQGQGEHGDNRSDIYSLGVVLYEMVTGRIPFDADTPYAVIMKHITDPLPLPRLVNPNLPEALERVILKALSKDPVGRFQSGLEFAAAIKNALKITADDNLAQYPVETIAIPPEIAPALAKITPTVPEPTDAGAMTTCPVCHEKSPAASKYCTACGNSLILPPTPDSKSDRFLLLGLGAGGIALIFVLFAVIAGLFFVLNRRGKVPVSAPVSAQISAVPTMTLSPTPSPTRIPATATRAPTATAQSASGDVLAIDTATPAPTSTSTHTPTPAPTATPTPLGQNCNRTAGGSFSTLWQKYRHLLGCPVSGQWTLSFMAEEVFQGGRMFWREDLDEIYVVFDRQANGIELFQGTWQTNPSWKWDGSYPNGTGASPPAGLVEPVRGFGWVWRNKMNGANGPLGWALEAEHGFDDIGQVQIFGQGMMFKGSSAKTYVLLNDGRFFAR